MTRALYLSGSCVRRRIDSFEMVKATRPAREVSAGEAVERRAGFYRWSVQLQGGWDVAVCVLKSDRVSPVTFTWVVEQVPPTSNQIPHALRLSETRERHESDK